MGLNQQVSKGSWNSGEDLAESVEINEFFSKKLLRIIKMADTETFFFSFSQNDSAAASSPAAFKLFIGNVDEKTQSTELRALFEKYGKYMVGRL